MEQKKKMALKQNLEQELFEQIIIMGDFNGVVNPNIDKLPGRKERKLPIIFFF